MRAIVQNGYGGPDVLSLEDIDRPVPADNEALVRVHAASLNVLDWRKMRASPFIVHLTEGFRRPRQPVLGVDTAGVVEAVGKDVTHVAPGDEVFGIGKGSVAEYTVGRTFAPKPSNLTFEEAAAVPVAGLTALQGVQEKAKVKEGERVLVNGAGGGVGHLTVQVARVFGAHVTATTRTEKLELIRSLGADKVIDYTRDDFRESGTTYDVIFEIGGQLTLPNSRRFLSPDGRLILVGAGTGIGGPIGRFVNASFRAKVLGQPILAFVSWESTDDLMTLTQMIESERVKPVVHRTFQLPDCAEAVHFLESGDVAGKIVVKL